jgi:hypothetical protein
MPEGPPTTPDPRATLAPDEESIAGVVSATLPIPGNSVTEGDLRQETRSTSSLEPSGDGRPRGAELATGHVVAGRYRLLEQLGAGGHGEVWSAEDLVLREQVALKWIFQAKGVAEARVRREITTLRMLRVPGVVRLLDEGVEDDHPFLVMERVEGAPFPGAVAPLAGPRPRWPWGAIAEPTMGLLEVLARVHGAGIVHRDLKPANILVSPAGRPTVLDFGVSLWNDPSGRLTAAGNVLGTPRFLAPEQILAGAVDARTDLYAVGVVLFEALTGRMPHEAPDMMTLLRARLAKPALPVHFVAPDVPDAVAMLVDRLLSQQASDRPRSAGEVLAVLRGQPAIARAAPLLPRLGDGAALAAILAAAAAGRSIDVVGPEGSGRTRCLEDAADALARAPNIRRVVRIEPARLPLASLLPVVGGADRYRTLTLAEVLDRVHDGLRTALAGGDVLLVDDADRLDAWSAAAIERARAEPGTIVRARSPGAAISPDAVRIDPLDEAALRPLFAGPDRLFHLREDAARALRERTGGLPGRVEAEVTLWTRLGLARRDGPLLVVDRDALSRLAAGLLDASTLTGPPAELAGEPHFEEVLRWVGLGGAQLSLPRLAGAMNQPVWKIEAACEVLISLGVARRLPDGRVVPRGPVDRSWPASQSAAAHQAIARALRPGEEGRLFHLLAADETREALAEAVTLALRLAREGHLHGAAAALVEGLRAARQEGDDAGEAEAQLLATGVKIAFAEETPHALDRALYEISRARSKSPALRQLSALVRAAIAAPGAGNARALVVAAAIPPFADPELERRRQRVRVVAAAVQPTPALLAEVLREVAAWADASGEPLARLALVEGQALLGYAEGRFADAAALYAQAAEQDPWLMGRIASTVKSAGALMECFRHVEAAERAGAAFEAAARCRHAYWEARAEWLLRAARYRMGEAREPDMELVQAMTRLGADDLEALVGLTEAAVAFRSGDRETAARLAGKAAALWRQLDRVWGALLARCLELASGGEVREGEARALAERALGCPVPGIGVQALGLLCGVFPEVRGWCPAEAVAKLAEGIPRERWGARIDVLSVEEALSGIGMTRQPDAPA